MRFLDDWERALLLSLRGIGRSGWQGRWSLYLREMSDGSGKRSGYGSRAGGRLMRHRKRRDDALQLSLWDELPIEEETKAVEAPSEQSFTQEDLLLYLKDALRSPQDNARRGWLRQFAGERE